MTKLSNLNYEVKADVKNEFTKTPSKDELKLELARAKELRKQYKKQYKKQKQIIIEQNAAKLKEIELELLHQKEKNKTLKTNNFTETIKQGIMSMILELAQQAIQEEDTNKLKQLDDYDNIYSMIIKK